MPRITKSNPLTNYISREEIARIRGSIVGQRLQQDGNHSASRRFNLFRGGEKSGKKRRGTSASRKEQTAAQPTKRTLKLTGSTGAVKARQRIEQTIALTAAQALLDAGYSLGVNDGEETTLAKSRDLDAIQAALFTTDDDYLYVYEGRIGQHNDSPDYWVRFVYGNDGWDVISDYTVHLESVIGEGTVVGKLVDYACDNGVVPDLYNK